MPTTSAHAADERMDALWGIYQTWMRTSFSSWTQGYLVGSKPGKHHINQGNEYVCHPKNVNTLKPHEHCYTVEGPNASLPSHGLTVCLWISFSRLTAVRVSLASTCGPKVCLPRPALTHGGILEVWRISNSAVMNVIPFIFLVFFGRLLIYILLFLRELCLCSLFGVWYLVLPV